MKMASLGGVLGLVGYLGLSRWRPYTFALVNHFLVRAIPASIVFMVVIVALLVRKSTQRLLLYMAWVNWPRWTSPQTPAHNAK